jgi:hypothetical protein
MITLGLLYWLLWLIGLFFGPWSYYDPASPKPFRYSIWLMALLFIIGWQVFGWPIAK